MLLLTLTHDILIALIPSCVFQQTRKSSNNNKDKNIYKYETNVWKTLCRLQSHLNLIMISDMPKEKQLLTLTYR